MPESVRAHRIERLAHGGGLLLYGGHSSAAGRRRLFTRSSVFADQPQQPRRRAPRLPLGTKGDVPDEGRNQKAIRVH